ncbi:MAG: HlyD family efflux transporter periplasmic adaptor subunit [Pirellulales bacterium]
MGKWLIVGLLAGIGVVAALVYAQVTQSVEVPTAEVEIGDIRQFVDERGKTRLPRVHLITMPYTGRIEEITLDEGDPVEPGALVARLVPADLQLSVDAASAAVERLDKSIIENDDTSVEEIGLKQALEFVTSMNASVKAALARVEAGLAKKQFATRQYKRKKELLPQGAASLQELERAEFNLVQSDVDLRQDELVHKAMVALQTATALMPIMIEQHIGRKDLSRDVLIKQKAEVSAHLAQAKQKQQRGSMTSPIDGIVLARHITNERYLSAGTTLLELGDLNELEVEANILSHEVVNIKKGDKARIFGPAIGAQDATGTVDRIYPAGFTKVSSLGVEQQRVKVIVKFDLDKLRGLIERQGLGVDYRVRVQIFTRQKEGVRVIPRSALFRAEDGSWRVFAVRNARARTVVVDVGLMNDDLVEVAGGELQKGDIVVLAPERSLTDGQRVESRPRLGTDSLDAS